MSLFAVPRRGRHASGDVAFGFFVLFVLLLQLALYGVILFVAIHFIVKWW